MSPEKKRGVVALAIVAGIALCLLVLYQSGERLGEGMQGPSKIARAPDGSIWVASHGVLHQFSESGERKRVLALSALGRGPFISELLPLSDGTLVIAQAEPSAAYRCDPAALKCTSITSEVAAKVGPTAHSLMVAADEKRRRYYVSDNAGHRLILLDFDGKVLDATKRGRFLHPNEIGLEKPGELLVVDTDHRRLVRVDVKRDAFGPDLWELKINSALTRPTRVLPMDFARSQDGGWWVLITRDAMKEGDLVLLDAQGKSIKRVDLGFASDPTQITAVAGGVLVADPTAATLMLVAPDGAVAGPWGGAAFQSELEALRASRLRWRIVRLAAQFLIFAIPLAGIVALWRMGGRVTARPVPAAPESPTPVEGGIHWMQVRPEFRRRTRTIYIVIAAMTWLSLAVAVWFASPFLGVSRNIDFVLVLLFVVWGLSPLPMLVRGAKAWRMRLGTDGRKCFFDPGNGKVEEHSFSAVVTSDAHRLLVGRRLIIQGTGKRSVFPEEELRGYILARIPPSGKVDSLRFMQRALDQGSRELWAGLIVIALGLALLLLPRLFPGLTAYLWNIVARLLGMR